MKHALKELRAPITPAFGTALALHAALLFGLGFSFQFAERPARTIAVTIALNPMAVAPDKAQHIAAENQPFIKQDTLKDYRGMKIPYVGDVENIGMIESMDKYKKYSN